MPKLRSQLPGLAPGWVMFCLATVLSAAEHTGIVRFNGLPVPGASITLTQNGKSRHTVTGMQGTYAFGEIEPVPFMVEVGMNLFATQRREFPDASQPAAWDLDVLPREELTSKVVRQTPETADFQRTAVSAAPVETPAQPPAADPSAAAELARQAADGFLISGTVHNAATSPFAQRQAFGNNRRPQRALYNGNLGVILSNSLFDARAYSLTGQNTLKPDYSRVQGFFSFGSLW